MDTTKRMIRVIQVGIRRLGLQEHEYRAIYEAATGKRSLKAMTARDMSSVLKEFARLGFSSATDNGSRPATDDGGRPATDNGSRPATDNGSRPAAARAAGNAPLCRTPQARKIRSLWLRLKDMGVLRDARESALLAYVHRLTGTERMEWCNAAQLGYVTETLKSWVERVQAEQLAAPCRQSAAKAHTS